MPINLLENKKLESRGVFVDNKYLVETIKSDDEVLSRFYPPTNMTDETILDYFYPGVKDYIDGGLHLAVSGDGELEVSVSNVINYHLTTTYLCNDGNVGIIFPKFTDATVGFPRSCEVILHGDVEGYSELCTELESLSNLNDIKNAEFDWYASVRCVVSVSGLEVLVLVQGNQVFYKSFYNGSYLLNNDVEVLIRMYTIRSGENYNVYVKVEVDGTSEYNETKLLFSTKMISFFYRPVLSCVFSSSNVDNPSNIDAYILPSVNISYMCGYYWNLQNPTIIGPDLPPNVIT